MGMRTTLMVQTFEIRRKRLRSGNRDVAPAGSGALKRAEAIASRTPGSAALRIVADDETGELESLLDDDCLYSCRLQACMSLWQSAILTLSSAAASSIRAPL